MKRSLVVVSMVWVSAALFSASLSAQTAGDTVADESGQVAKGRLVVAQACTTCHTTLGRMLQVHKQTAPQWKDTVYFMISRGAQVMPDEIDAVATFLAQSSAAEGRDGARGAADQAPIAPRRGGGGRGQGGADQASPAPTGRAN